MDIKVRKATRMDIPAIHNLVRELAIYEKSEPEFIASLEDYYQDFEEGVFESEVAEKEGAVIGMIIYYMSYSTWKGRMLYLEDFVVDPAYRRQGVGQILFDAYLETAKQKKCRMVKWQVLAWNQSAIDFYEKNHATIEKGWWNGKIIF